MYWTVTGELAYIAYERLHSTVTAIGSSDVCLRLHEVGLIWVGHMDVPIQNHMHVPCLLMLLLTSPMTDVALASPLCPTLTCLLPALPSACA